MPISNFSNGISNNFTMREFPILDLQNGKANVFWVDSNKGSDGNRGTFIHPFATLDYAIGRCTANQGDKIFVAAGHVETITSATALVLDIAGIEIIGLGTKENRPVYTFTTATAASVVISANDIYISNLVFKGNIASQVTILDCNAKRTVIDNCYFTEGTAQPLTHIDINGGGANACDGIKIINCTFNAPTANATAAIELGEVADSVIIDNCSIWGDFSDAGIHNPTGKILTNLTIINSTISNNQTGDHAIELVSACTGIAQNLYMYADAFATAFDPGALKCFETYSVSAADVNGRLNPVVET
jgi:hypothetical protein